MYSVRAIWEWIYELLKKYTMTNRVKSTINAMRTRGAVAPSSKFLVRKMLSKIDYSHDLELLQLGFGSGVFTRGIVEKMTLGSSLVIFEVDGKCRKHEIEDDRIRYIEDSAEKISHYFGDRQFDHIISTLPFASLPKRVSDGILQEIRQHLKKNGTFLQFQYSLFSKKDIRMLFDDGPRIDFEILNFPPAFIYETTNVGTRVL